MKKAILFAMLFSLLSVQQIHAQKWLKTLGKAANTVLNDAAKSEQKSAQKTTALPIKSSGTTNMDNFSCTYPDMKATFKSCVRQGDKVIITIVFNNEGKADLEVCPNYNNDAIFDADGDSYRLDVDGSKCCGEPWSSAYNKKFPVGVPVKATFAIKNVPASVTKMSLVKIGCHKRYEGSNFFYLEFHNLPISAQ